MVLKHVTLEVTKEAYNNIKSDFGGRSYGNYKGLNLVIYRSITNRYYIEFTDYIDRIER